MLEIIKGSRDYLEAAYFLSQVALFVVAIAAARFAYNQVKTAGNLELVKLLQEPRIQAAGTRVILDLADKSFEEWNGMIGLRQEMLRPATISPDCCFKDASRSGRCSFQVTQVALRSAIRSWSHTEKRF
ncbi:hypothetical protein FHT78_005413 [Rhizobium sp. BK196]|uniref:hypothetical protein n=1 Tax=Rhizobium sp. BK196 TaxID=2587073 RepID=UPI0016185A5F|nr:hypothetical protein [Rhizobium sp. BK196]MBB3313619.1 hypothetical protein [Rhizobium sp. BK196]